MPDAGITERLDTLHQWVASRHDVAVDSLRLELAAGDASFRRYFRLWLADGQTRIIMDAPPEKENSHPFVTIANDWRHNGLPVPALYEIDLKAGFIELEDLGDTPLQLCLNGGASKDSQVWHERALALIGQLQNRAPCDSLPLYGRPLLERELDLFPEWCLQGLLNIALPPCWSALRHRLCNIALSQPRVAVHRDYDAMNLMVRDQRLWLIDFQDAVQGALSYDLVSLLRGRYCRFSRERFTTWVEAFRQQAIDDGRLTTDIDHETFLHMADSMAAQRSLKVLGIFCRLTLRDGKTGYLDRLPYFLDHLRDSLAPWGEYREMLDWLNDAFAPALDRELTQRGIAGVVA